MLQPGCSGDTAYEEVRIGEKNPGDCHARKQVNERGSGGEWVVGSIFKLRGIEPDFVDAPREKFWRFSTDPATIRQAALGKGNP